MLRAAVPEMKTILVLASHPGLADSIRAALDAARYRIIHRVNTTEAEPLLAHALVNICVVDAEFADIQGTWIFETIRRHLPSVPLIVYCDEGPWPLEEEAYLAGASHILRKPVRARLLEAVLGQRGSMAATTTTRPSLPSRPASPSRVPDPVALRAGGESTVRALQKWREFSSLLSCSLTTDALLKQFLLQFREVTGVSRAAIFLRQPAGQPGHAATVGAGRTMRAACAIGLPADTLEHLQLSFESGIGAHLFHHGRIVWRDTDECRADAEMEQEFSRLGVQVVVPILDRQTMVGLAALDGRITGEALSHEELEIIFHVLEQLGLAIRNAWFHDQLAANQRMLTEVLRQFSSGCLVIGSDLVVQHCNDTARRFLLGSRREAEVHFSDLPVVLGGKIYQVLKSGAALAPFRFQAGEESKLVYQVSIVPLHGRASATPDSALMVIEDRTQMEQLHNLELEATNLRLIKSMSDRLAHEIGNALVPISTHQQLIADQYRDPDFRESLDLALADGVKRISRLLNQMRFLSRDSLAMEDTFPLGPVLEEAFRDAQTHQTVKSALLKYDDGNQPPVVSGDRAALKYAFLEVFLNALQANPNDARIAVKMKPAAGFNDQGKRWAQVEVQDNGAGFSPEALASGAAPFFTTRTVGLGLGLTVTRKIVETHHGRMEIVNPAEGHHGLVRIFLPQSAN